MPEDTGAFIKTIFRKQASLNILAQVASVVGPLVCTSIVGAYYGSGGLAIMAICAPMFLAASFFGAIGGGAQILCSELIAKDEIENVNKVYSAAIVLTLAAAAAFCAALIAFKTPILTLVAGEITPELSAYYNYFVLYSFFTMPAFIPLYFSKVAGRPEIGVVLTVTMSAVSIAASILLIGAMGIEAVALGQAIGTVAGLFASMYMLQKHFRFRFPKKLYARQIFLSGSPVGLPRMYVLIKTLLLNALFLRVGGNIALAVFGVISMLHRFNSAAINGISQTLTPLVGVFHEEQDTISIRQTMKTAFLYGNALMVLIGLILCVFGNQIGIAFGLSSDAGIFGYAMPFYAVYITVLMNSMIFSAYYNASKHLILANIIPFLQELALLCAGAYIFAGLFGINGIWAAFPASGAVTMLMLLSILSVIKRKSGDTTMFLLQSRRLQREGRYISFSVDGSLKEAGEAAARIGDFCVENGVSPKQTMQISMSIEEIITLIINNNKRKNLSVSVRLFLLDGTIVLRIRNAGDKFNAIEYYEQNIAEDIERSLEVIGMKYIVQSANVIYYRQTFGVNSLVVLL
ncbi:MAG: MATE family efflux transporter [Oscillospiraceae bacterium]|nr:MATE family efflux transporter [Oscillospiraceae bacterium]